MEQAGAIVARNYHLDQPDVGPVLETEQCRVLIGWNHQTDTPAGLRRGKMWCWVLKGQDALHIYDTEDNRSPFPGDVVFCGHANFTMVRMFHPYWTTAGIPKDMNSQDKARCRRLYRQLVAPHELARRERANDGDYPDSDDGGGGEAYFMNRRQTAAQRRREKKREERRGRKRAIRANKGKSAKEGERTPKKNETAGSAMEAANREARRKVDAPEDSGDEGSEDEVEIIEVRASGERRTGYEPADRGGESAFDARGVPGLDDNDEELARARDELIGAGVLDGTEAANPERDFNTAGEHNDGESIFIP